VVPPSANTQAKIRFAVLVPGAPNVDIKLSNGVTFANVVYETITDYQELPEGAYKVDVFPVNSNASIFSHSFNFTGGLVYTIFAEGLPSSVDVITIVDYFPPAAFNLRVFHASPDVPIVDALVDGSSKGLNGITFTTNTAYISVNEGPHNFTIQTANEKNPSHVYISEHFTTLLPYNDYSIFLVGSMNHTANNTKLETVTFLDDNTLPPKVGDVRVRFVHASPDAPAVPIRANGAQLFASVPFKHASNYTELAGGIWSLELLVANSDASLLSASVDLRVKEQGRAVYTVVAEGFLHPLDGEPGLKLYAFLDNGQGHPDVPTPSPSGTPLSGVVIGLIIAGVAIFVIAVAAGGFVLWKRRHQRAGYTEIEAHGQ